MVLPVKNAVYANDIVPKDPVPVRPVGVNEICGVNNPKLPTATCPLSGAETSAPIVPTLPVPDTAVCVSSRNKEPKLTDPDADTAVVAADVKVIGVPEKLISENASSPYISLRDVNQRGTSSIGRHDKRERTSGHSL